MQTGASNSRATGITGGESIALTYDSAGFSDAIKAKFPNLASYGVIEIGGGRSGKGTGHPLG